MTSFAVSKAKQRHRISIENLIKRLKKFNLEIAEDKTKIIPFGDLQKKLQEEWKGKPQLLTSLGLPTIVAKVKMENFV